MVRSYGKVLSPCQSTTSVGGDWRKGLLDDSGASACEKHAAQTHKGKMECDVGAISTNSGRGKR